MNHPRSENLSVPTTTSVVEGAKLREWFELTKPRLSLLSVITAIVGYLVAQPVRDIPLLFSLLIGTSLAAGGAAAMNMWMERDIDAKMARTRNRPIPSGAVSAEVALITGLVLCASGNLLLLLGVNALAASLALFTQISYLLAYTPMKQVTPWNTEIGAIPGAVPPLIGWAAAQGSLGLLAWILFGIVLTWQIPHFMAIAWMYRDDYARAGFKMLPGADARGTRTANRALVFAILMTLVSVLPWAFGMTTALYGVIAVALGGWFTMRSLRFKRAICREPDARKLFIASIVYLPAILAILVIDRWLLVG